MTDRYQQFARTSVGHTIVRRLGLPDPTPLRRYRPGEPPLPGPARLGAAPGGRLLDAVRTALKSAGVDLSTEPAAAGPRPGALVFDATGITDPAGLRELHAFFKPELRSLASSGRVLVLGTPRAACRPPR